MLAAPLQLRRDPRSRPGSASCPSRSSASRPDRVRSDGAADPDLASRSRTRPRCSRRSASSARSCRSSSTTTACGTCTSRSARRRRSPRCEPDLTALSDLPDVVGVNCFAGSGSRWKTRMFAPQAASSRIPATGSAAGSARRAPRAPRPDRLRRARSRSRRASRSGGPSMLYARVDGSRRGDRTGRGRRQRRDRRARRVQASLSSSASISGSSSARARQKTPPFVER